MLCIPYPNLIQIMLKTYINLIQNIQTPINTDGHLLDLQNPYDPLTAVESPPDFLFWGTCPTASNPEIANPTGRDR